jgi:hypothetical protein
MADFVLAPDGLLIVNDDPGEVEFPPVDIPPFPFGELMRFLDTAGQGGETMRLQWPILLPLILILPFLFHRRTEPSIRPFFASG